MGCITSLHVDLHGQHGEMGKGFGSTVAFLHKLGLVLVELINAKCKFAFISQRDHCHNLVKKLFGMGRVAGCAYNRQNRVF